MAICIFLISLIQAIPPDLPGVPPSIVPYIKAILSGLTAMLIFLQTGKPEPPSEGVQNIPKD
jgi:hypothetical protein